jgi:hypothetical protein
MNWFRCRNLQAAVVACSIVLLPLQQILAANPQLGAESSSSPRLIRDVALQPGGVLSGQVLDSDGNPCAGLAVRIVRAGGGQELAAGTQTTADGRFTFSELSGGVYRVETPVGVEMCRLWAPDTAPPSAVPAVLLVAGQDAVRGNLGQIGWLGWTLIGLGVAAAIAIPLALDDDDAS